MKAARDRARAERGVRSPNMVLPASAHAAFEKGAAYFDVESRRIPVRADWRADVDAMAAAIDDDTVLVVASAPQYPQGVIDDVAGVAALAAAHGINCHVDACMGGVVPPLPRRRGAVELRRRRGDEHLRRPAQVRLHGQGRRRARPSHQGAALAIRPSSPTTGSAGCTARRASSARRAADRSPRRGRCCNHLGDDGYRRLAGVARRTCLRLAEAIGEVAGVARSSPRRTPRWWRSPPPTGRSTSRRRRPAARARLAGRPAGPAAVAALHGQRGPRDDDRGVHRRPRASASPRRARAAGPTAYATVD